MGAPLHSSTGKVVGKDFINLGSMWLKNDGTMTLLRL
jgi:hypothetical protein